MDSDDDDLMLAAAEEHHHDNQAAASHDPAETPGGSAARKRKIHMREDAITDYNQTEPGSVALKHPGNVLKSSKDPNRGLYPRENKRKSQTLFQSAGALLNPKLPFLPIESTSASTSRSLFQSASSLLSPKLPCSPTRSVASSPSKNKSVIRSPIKQCSQGSILYYCVSNSPQSSSNSSSQPVTPSHQKVSPACDRLSLSQPTPSHSASTTSSSTASDTFSRRLFQAQKLANSQSPAKKRRKTEKKRTAKVPVYNRDNKFLYSDNKTDVSSSDPLNMGVKLKQKDSGVNSDSGTDDEDLSSYFDILPDEVIENIFCRLPFLDLHLNLPTVCHLWNDIVSDEKFIPWKKKYYKMKMTKDGPEMQSVFTEMRNHGMTSIDNYLTGLIKYMCGYKRVDSAVASSLKRHSKYQWAVELLRERLPECVDGEEVNPWSLITTLCIVSHSVRDISAMIGFLLAGDTYMMAIDVVECLYCVACFLLCFKTLRYHDVWTSMHYRVYYALYLFENQSSSSTSQLKGVFRNTGQQSLIKYSSNAELELTHEQMRIVKYDPKGSEIAKIVAFAGTGKTTTLVKYTKLRPSKRFLMLVFNKSVKEHAEKIFPGNVTCKTGHGLAFRSVGSRYKNGKFSSYGLKIGNILKMIKARKGISLYVQAKFVQDTLCKFLCSADDFLTTAHVPTQIMGEDGKIRDIDHDQQMKIASDAELIWNRMVDLADFGAQMVHDGYLKLFQLRKWQLYGYDMILIDEAQDLTPAVYDILMRQKVPKIFVGDPNQQIYSFRGAINAMSLIQPTQTFYLTQSFRFGPDIAFVANSALEFLKGETKRTLVGNAKDSGILGDAVGQVAVITRTNFTLFAEAVKKCCYSDEDVKVAFAGGIASFGFQMIQSIYALMLPPSQRKPHQVKDLKSSFIGNFNTLADLEKYATKTQDTELNGKIRIVKTYSHNLPSLIDKIMKKTVNIEKTADVVFSTAHKAKGLEFSTVKITDDYNVEPSPLTAGMYSRGSAAGDEGNLLYVAVTRAKKRLIMTSTLVKLLDVCGEKFVYPQLSTSLESDAKLFKCCLTDREFTPCALTLVKHKVTLGDNKVQGKLSPQVLTEEMTSLGRLYGSSVILPVRTTYLTLALDSLYTTGSGDSMVRAGGMLCPQVITEEMTSLRRLYGSSKDERTPEEIEKHAAAAARRRERLHAGGAAAQMIVNMLF